MVQAESLYELLTPADLGLPAKFKSYRLPQRQALRWLNEECLYPLSAANLPTGIGKTALAISFAKLLGVKAAYLVATKALQEQVHDDFRSMGSVIIKGRANYVCPTYRNCDAGTEAKCSIAGTTGCPYTCATERAKDSDLPVGNYAYWMYARKYTSGALERDFRPIELLICDEAHTLEQQLSSFASVKVYQSEAARLGGRAWPKDGIMDNPLAPVAGSDGGQWVEWAHAKKKQLDSEAGELDELDDDAKDLYDRCNKILRMGSNWVWQFDDRTGHATFEPIRLTGFASALFSGVPRILLMSASLTKFALKLILPPDFGPYDYRAWGQVFNPANSPVYHIPTRKLTRNSTDEDYQALIQMADQIIDNRLDRKGIIHTVSYARSRRALQYSRHAGRFIWNEKSEDLKDRLGKFRDAPAGAILVTPSVEEGFDFPADECRYQIVLKFPFPNEGQRVIKERCNQIPGYRLHYAAQKIVQMRGRPIRSYEDWAEMFVLDNSVAQLNSKEAKSYTPPGFRLFTVSKPPAPPPLDRKIF